MKTLVTLVLFFFFGLISPVTSQQLPDPNEAVFSKGLLDEDEAAYRSFPKTRRYRAFLPAQKDLSSRFPTPGKQGKQGSCVGWAVGYAARSYYGPNGRPGRGKHSLVSPSFIYNHIKDLEKDCEVGSRISDALELLQEWGALSVAEFPYSEKNCTERTSMPKHKERMARFRIKNWRRVDVQELDDVKGQIAKGNPVIIGMRTSSRLHRLKGNAVYDFQGSDSYDGNHAVTVVGYSDRKQAFNIINSWGRKWGNGGFGWVDYGTFRKLTKYGFVMELELRKPPVVKITPPKPRPQPVTPPPEPPSPPEGFDITALLERLGPLSCSHLEHRAGAKGAELSGFVGTAEDLQKVKKLVARQGVPLGLNVEVRPWPQCEALLTLEEPLQASRGLTLKISGANGKTTLTEGENLVLKMTAPDFPAYLYLTYLPASGDAVHLIQPRSVVSRQYGPKGTVTLGDGVKGGPKFVVGPPYGNEMVLAIASPAPLFDEPRKPTETEREYLTAIRSALLKKPPGTTKSRTVAAAAVTLKTRER